MHQIPLDLKSYTGQAVLRLFASYFSEEIWEADQTRDVENSAAKELEELSDAFHFLIEMCLMAGITPLTLISEQGGDRSVNMGAAYGNFLHSLRHKPWKRLPTTVEGLVRNRLKDLYRGFLLYVRRSGFSEDQLIEVYLAKAQVNQQRIDAGM